MSLNPYITTTVLLDSVLTLLHNNSLDSLINDEP